MRHTKRIVSLLCSATMVCSLMAPVAYAAEFKDMPNDWSTAALERAVENGLLTGFDGNIMPDQNLTRAEMASILTRAFGAGQMADCSGFDDIPADAWYADAMGKALQMGIFQGDGSAMYPENSITRQEVFAVLARGFVQTSTDTAILDDFSDGDLVADWAKDSTAALVEAGFVQGSEGKLNPLSPISRKEFASLMDRMVAEYMRTSGTYSTDAVGNLMVTTPDVVLKDMTVSGDLIVSDGVGNGDFTLDGVTVTGNLIVRGGGNNTVALINGTEVQGTVIAHKLGSGDLRLLTDEHTHLSAVSILAATDEVILEGSFGTVSLSHGNTLVTAKNATVAALELLVADATVALENTTVDKLEVSNSDTTVTQDDKSTIKETVDNTTTDTNDKNTSTGGSSGGSTTLPEEERLYNAVKAEIKSNVSLELTYLDDVLTEATNKGIHLNPTNMTIPGLDMPLNDLIRPLVEAKNQGTSNELQYYGVNWDDSLRTFYFSLRHYTNDDTFVETLRMDVPTEVIDTYTVSFDLAGYSDEVVENQIVVKDATVQVPTLTDVAGQFLCGWMVDGQPFDFATPITEATNLIAQWVTVSESKEIASLDTTDFDGQTMTALQYDTMLSGLSVGTSATAEDVFTALGVATPTTLYALDSDGYSIFNQDGTRQGVTVTDWSIVYVATTDDPNYQGKNTLTATISETAPEGFTWESSAPATAITIKVDNPLIITGLGTNPQLNKLSYYSDLQLQVAHWDGDADALFDTVKLYSDATLPTETIGIVAGGTYAENLPIAWTASVTRGSEPYYTLTATTTESAPLGHQWADGESVSKTWDLYIQEPALISDLYSPSLENTTLEAPVSDASGDLAQAVFAALGEEMPSTLEGFVATAPTITDGSNRDVAVTWTAEPIVRSDNAVVGYTLTASPTGVAPLGYTLWAGITLTLDVTVSQDALTGTEITGLVLPEFTRISVANDYIEQSDIVNSTLTDAQIGKLTTYVYSASTLPTTLTTTVASGEAVEIPVVWTGTYTPATVSKSAYFSLIATVTEEVPTDYWWQSTPTVSKDISINNTKEYTVTLDWNNGVDSKTKVETEGRLLTIPTNDTYSGHVVTGWFTDEDCTTAYNIEQTITSDVTIYAKWLEADTETTQATSVDLSVYDKLTLTAADAWALIDTTDTSAVWTALDMTAPTELILTSDEKALVKDKVPVTVGVESFAMACSYTEGSDWTEGGTIELTITFGDISDNTYGWVDDTAPETKITIAVDPSAELMWDSISFADTELTAEEGAAVLAVYEKNSPVNHSEVMKTLLPCIGGSGATDKMSCGMVTADGETILVTITFQFTYTEATATELAYFTASTYLHGDYTLPNGYFMSQDIEPATQNFTIASQDTP